MKKIKPKSSKGKEELNQINTKNKLEDIKADFFLIKLFCMLHKRRTLKLIRYNKYMQQRINININNYKDSSRIYSSIAIELIPFLKNYLVNLFILEKKMKNIIIYILIIILKK